MLARLLENPNFWAIAAALTAAAIVGYFYGITGDSEARRIRTARHLQEMAFRMRLPLEVLYFLRSPVALTGATFDRDWVDYGRDDLPWQRGRQDRVQRLANLVSATEQLRNIVSDLVLNGSSGNSRKGRDDLTIVLHLLEVFEAQIRRPKNFDSRLALDESVDVMDQTWHDIAKAIVDPLLAKMKSRDRFTSCYSADVTGTLASEFYDAARPAVDALSQLLLNGDPFRRHAAAQALYLIGPAARSRIEVLQAAADSFKNESAGAIASRLVERMKDEASGEVGTTDS